MGVKRRRGGVNNHSLFPANFTPQPTSPPRSQPQTPPQDALDRSAVGWIGASSERPSEAIWGGVRGMQASSGDHPAEAACAAVRGVFGHSTEAKMKFWYTVRISCNCDPPACCREASSPQCPVSRKLRSFRSSGRAFLGELARPITATFRLKRKVSYNAHILLPLTLQNAPRLICNTRHISCYRFPPF